MPRPAQSSSGGNKKDNSLTGAISEINQEFKEKEVQQKARELGLPYIDVATLPINDDLLRLIPEEKSREGDLIPFFQVGKKLRVAVLNIEKEETKNIIATLEEKNFVLNINICSPNSLAIAQKNYSHIKTKNTDVDDLQSQMLVEAQNISNEIHSLSEMPQKFGEIQSDLALAILHRKALNLKASDVHFESIKKGVRIRGRVDGMLQDFFILSRDIANGIIRQIKFSANIASNVPGVPADGQLSFAVGERNIMVRVSVLPGKKGESIVLRYLDPKNQKRDLSQSGFLETEEKKIKKLVHLKQGLVLVTGPTGSGKTTTLYSMLKSINTPEKKIITLEDPVEYEVEGIVQSSINTEKGYTFSSGLRACLRQDPDILLIGEIRDIKTAQAALQASLTGHFVLSTVHTNSAIETIVRLRDLGVENYLIASSLKGIIAQRLVRKPCRHCRTQVDFTTAQKKILLDILRQSVKNGENLPPLGEKMWQGTGCKKCGNTKYKGQTVVSEIISVDTHLASLITQGAGMTQIQEYLDTQHQKFFAFDAAIKILQGKTDFDEGVRVLGSSFIS